MSTKSIKVPEPVSKLVKPKPPVGHKWVAKGFGYNSHGICDALMANKKDKEWWRGRTSCIGIPTLFYIVAEPIAKKPQPKKGMKPETLAALKESIAHWERMANGNPNKETPQSNECALCQRFSIGCRTSGEKCPVFLFSGFRSCINTPWRGASDARFSGGLTSKEFCDAAKKELKFLKSLLPKEEKRTRKPISEQEVQELLLSKKFGQKKLLKLRAFINRL
jgi:hypothetical protein